VKKKTQKESFNQKGRELKKKQRQIME